MWALLGAIHFLASMITSFFMASKSASPGGSVWLLDPHIHLLPEDLSSESSNATAPKDSFPHRGAFPPSAQLLSQKPEVSLDSCSPFLLSNPIIMMFFKSWNLRALTSLITDSLVSNPSFLLLSNFVWVQDSPRLL